MAKRKKNEITEFSKDLTLGGMTIGLGSALTGKLPSSPATSNVQQGFTTAARFTPMFATVGAAGLTLKQIKSLEKKLKGGKK